MVLSADSLSFSYGRRRVLDNVSLKLHAGEWLTIVGPNGAGKTTLLRCLLGLLRPQSGDVRCSRLAAMPTACASPRRSPLSLRLNQHCISQLSRREVAQQIALLPQLAEIPFGFSVREVVSTGRTPHVSRLQPLQKSDHKIIDEALQATETFELADRPITALSGGELQRVFLARAFAQDTPILALDEPTTNLDLFHEKTLLDKVQERQRQGTAIIAVLHDLNLAARYSDRLLALADGRVAAQGTPNEILKSELIESVFRVKTRIERDPEKNRIWVLS